MLIPIFELLRYAAGGNPTDKPIKALADIQERFEKVYDSLKEFRKLPLTHEEQSKRQTEELVRIKKDLERIRNELMADFKKQLDETGRIIKERDIPLPSRKRVLN